MKVFFLICTAFLLGGCSLTNGHDREAAEAAVGWAEAYFNYDFHKAEEYTTPESGKWLKFAASNTTEHDLQLVQQNENGATAEVEDFFPEANDTLRMVLLKVNNFVSSTLPATSAQLVDEGLFQVTTVLRDGKWQVRMAGLPRSERQSRD
jgi:hypothetical protein